MRYLIARTAVLIASCGEMLGAAQLPEYTGRETVVVGEVVEWEFHPQCRGKMAKEPCLPLPMVAIRVDQKWGPVRKGEKTGDVLVVEMRIPEIPEEFGEAPDPAAVVVVVGEWVDRPESWSCGRLRACGAKRRSVFRGDAVYRRVSWSRGLATGR